MVSQGPKSKLPGERIRTFSLFHELTPDSIKFSWDERLRNANMAARGQSCEDGREGNSERCGQENVSILSLASVAPLGVVFVIPSFLRSLRGCNPSHYLGLSSNITSLEKHFLTTLAEITIILSPLLPIFSLL